MSELEEDVVSLMRKRVYDCAGVLGKGVKVGGVCTVCVGVGLYACGCEWVCMAMGDISVCWEGGGGRRLQLAIGNARAFSCIPALAWLPWQVSESGVWLAIRNTTNRSCVVLPCLPAPPLPLTGVPERRAAAHQVLL